MPRNAADTEGAAKIIAMGYPMIEPIHRDMVLCMRVADSLVGNAFAAYFADTGGAAAPAISEGLQRENCWLRHRFFTIVLPAWSDHDLAGIANMLTMVATQPDAFNNDIRCVGLLAERGLADPSWLSDWIGFKRERMRERAQLIEKVSDVINKAHPAKKNE